MWGLNIWTSVRKSKWMWPRIDEAASTVVCTLECKGLHDFMLGCQVRQLGGCTRDYPSDGVPLLSSVGSLVNNPRVGLVRPLKVGMKTMVRMTFTTDNCLELNRGFGNFRCVDGNRWDRKDLVNGVQGFDFTEFEQSYSMYMHASHDYIIICLPSCMIINHLAEKP